MHPGGAQPSPIGSVLPFPQTVADLSLADSVWAAWTGAYRSVSAFRSARGALAALLHARAVRRIWLPAYACPVIADAAAGCDRNWYGVGPSLDPELEELRAVLAPGHAVLVIDYFGRPAASGIVALAKARPDVLWIEDRAQALDTGEPAWADVVLYSPRKLVGVGEGGVLVSDGDLPQPSGLPHPVPSVAQHMRRGDPSGCHRQAWFTAFQAQEAAMAIDNRPMGAEAEMALRHTPIRTLAARRRANAAILTAHLAPLVLWPASGPHAPLAVPIRVAERDALAAHLADQGIFCARHWAALPSDPARFPTAHRLAAELLSLPCDDSYGPADMARIVAAIRAVGVNALLTPRAHHR